MSTMGEHRRPRRRAVAVGLVSLAVAAALLAVVPQSSTAQDGHFSDLQGHWARSGVDYLMDTGILGDPLSTWCGPTEFCPDRPVARWMAAVWLVRALANGQDPAPVTETSFPDVNPSDYWAPHIERLAALGLTYGYEDGTFRPHAPVRRRHMNAFLERGESVVAGTDQETALRHGGLVMLRTCHNGGISCPNEQVNRGESASILAAALKGELDQPPTAAPEDGGFFWTIAPGLSAGNYHTCALRHAGPEDDTVNCWGLNSHGQTDVPYPDEKYKVVAAGGAHTCALRRNGRVDCWGLNNHGQSSPPDFTFHNIAAGDVTTCGIRTHENRLYCWGKQFGTIPDGHFDNLSVGSNHACAIHRGAHNNSLRKAGFCWGDDTYGEVYNFPGNVPNQFLNFQYAGRHYFSLAAGLHFTCAAIHEGDPESSNIVIERTAYLKCWGRNDNGQAPPGPGREKVGHYVEGDTRLVEHALDVGWWHGCAVKHDGHNAFCWGDNSHGQLNAPADTTFTYLAAGALHACGTEFTTFTGHSQKIVCWGFDV